MREENVQVDLGKQLNGTRLPLAMSPTTKQFRRVGAIEEYR
jgi:hypothetical protein